MHLNKAVIPHYRSERIPIEKLKYRVALNENYLREKPDWYEIEGKLQYFKIRSDFRLFTEQFFSMFGREVMELDTLDYRVAYVRTINPVIKKSQEITQCGLLSDNFQTLDNNYYLVSELLNSLISDFKMYGGYTLENLLAFFRDYLDEKDYKANELFLIKLFIADAITHQEDRNHNNICYKIPKIEGIPYTRRLHPEIIKKYPNASGHYVMKPDGGILLKGLTPAKVYDNERIFGTDHKNVFTYHPGQVWRPLFPYSKHTLFKSPEEAAKAQREYDGLDPNLFELYINHQDVCRPIFERLVYDSEYRRILERFKGETSQICLSDKSAERITQIFEDKQMVLARILKY
ncbi:MAG: hypothetical protein E7161_00230 [Firmicutes bacterium]|nr:hypothetical protein [Bacillota bacterium]